MTRGKVGRQPPVAAKRRQAYLGADFDEMLQLNTSTFLMLRNMDELNKQKKKSLKQSKNINSIIHMNNVQNLNGRNNISKIS